MKKNKQLSPIPFAIFFIILFVIGVKYVIFIDLYPKTPEEIERCNNQYLNFSFKGKYIDLVGVSGAAKYLKIKPDEINGYDKCFFSRLQKRNDYLYCHIILETFDTIPFNSRGVIYKRKGNNIIYYKFKGRRYEVNSNRIAE